MFYPYKKVLTRKARRTIHDVVGKDRFCPVISHKRFFVLKWAKNTNQHTRCVMTGRKKVVVQWWRHVPLPPLAFDIFTNFAPQTLSDGHDVKLKLFWLIQGLQGGAGEGPPSILCTCTCIVYTSKFISIPHWVLFNKGMMTLKLGVMTFIFPTCSSSSTPPVPLLKLLLYSATNSTLE